MKFLADDGKIFENRADCEKYENEIGVRQLNRRCITMPFVEDFTGYECIFEFYDINNREDFEVIKDFYKDDGELYGFDAEDLSKFTQFPFTAVVLHNDGNYVDLLSTTKKDVIGKFEDFINKLKEA